MASTPTTDRLAGKSTPRPLPECMTCGDVSVFEDQLKREYVAVRVHGHREVHPLNGRWFHKWLARDMIARRGTATKQEVRNLIWELGLHAEDAPRPLEARSAWSPDRSELWIDLGNAAWQAARVTADGWEVVDDPPTLFRRHQHMEPLPVPISGDVERLLDFLPPIRREHDRLLALVWVTAALIPMPRPVLLLTGPRGAAKSTFSRFVRQLLDPSRTPLLGKDARADMQLVFLKHAVVVLDNIDRLAPAEADLLCQAVTGVGVARRALYTDDDEYLATFRRPIILNGLHPPTDRADLLDRTINLDLDRLTTEQRLTLGGLERDFETARPALLGGLLGAISRAMKLLPEVSRAGLTRMADFHHFGRAVARALGRTEATFDDAVREAVARQTQTAVENALAQAVLLFARQTASWQGRAQDLLDRLVETAQRHHIRRTPEFWPDSADALGRRVKPLGELLAPYGVTVCQRPRGKQRQISVSYDPAAESVGVSDAD